MDNCTTVKSSDVFELGGRCEEILAIWEKLSNRNTFSLGKKEFSRWQTLSLHTQTTVKLACLCVLQDPLSKCCFYTNFALLVKSGDAAQIINNRVVSFMQSSSNQGLPVHGSGEAAVDAFTALHLLSVSRHKAASPDSESLKDATVESTTTITCACPFISQQCFVQ